METLMKKNKELFSEYKQQADLEKAELSSRASRRPSNRSNNVSRLIAASQRKKEELSQRSEKSGAPNNAKSSKNLESKVSNLLSPDFINQDNTA